MWQEALADLWFTRPGGGLEPAAGSPVEAARTVFLAPMPAGPAYVARELSRVLGRRALRPLACGTPLTLDTIERDTRAD